MAVALHILCTLHTGPCEALSCLETMKLYGELIGNSMHIDLSGGTCFHQTNNSNLKGTEGKL